MDRERLILEAITLLQANKVKDDKLPWYHYAIDYACTAAFLSAYCFMFYLIYKAFA